jgi:hypothetical protein
VLVEGYHAKQERSLQAHARPHQVVDVARAGRQPKRFSALMISATAASTICDQDVSPSG